MTKDEGSPFATLLRHARVEAGLTQQELSERSGISIRSISDLERGINRAPQPETLRLLADALDLPPEERRRWNALRQRLAARPARQGSPRSTGPPQQTSTLPHPLTALVGRSNEIAGIAALLCQPNVRMVTLTGPGGVGKTRLAIAVAEQLRERFRDDVSFVDLSSLTAPDHVPSMLAAACGIRLTGRQSDWMSLISALGPSHRLLVLDNVEQVIDVAPRLTDLLHACPRLTMVTTSRVPLRLRGEQEYAVAPLTLPDEEDVEELDQLRQVASIALFVERAQAVRADFAVTRENALDVAAICKRLDGLPLAIELAAAQIRVLPPSLLLRRLEKRLPLLANAPRDAPARHATLSSTIAWSYDRLEPKDQQLFEACSVFQNGWTLAAAEAVGSNLENGADGAEWTVVSGIESLIQQSLVRMTVQPDGEPRYRMLETIAEFGRDRLSASPDATSIYKQHAEYFLQIAQRAETQITGIDQAQWIAVLEVEHFNLRAAIRWALARGATGDVGAVIMSVQLISALWWFWYVNGYLFDARVHALAPTLEMLRAMHADVVSTLGHDQWLRLYAKMLFMHAATATWQSAVHDEQSWSDMHEALTIYRQLDQVDDIASTLIFLGYGAERIGNFAEARAYLDEGIALYRQHGNDAGIALGLQALGMIGLRTGTYDQAVMWLEESLGHFQRVGDARGIASARATLGAVYLYQGHHESAMRLLTESLYTRHELGDTGGIAWCLEYVAHLTLGLGDDPSATGARRAARLLGAAARLRASTGYTMDPVDRPTHEHLLARVQERLPDAAFVAAWEAGRGMTLDEVVRYALHLTENLDS